MSGDDFIGFGLGCLLLLFAGFLLVVALGAAGCIKSEAFTSRKTIVIVSDPEEVRRALEHAR